jgi:hypothetical protein
MIVVCCVCEHAGLPALLGETAPLEDRAVSHGLCEPHAAEILAELRARVAAGTL